MEMSRVVKRTRRSAEPAKLAGISTLPPPARFFARHLFPEVAATQRIRFNLLIFLVWLRDMSACLLHNCCDSTISPRQKKRRVELPIAPVAAEVTRRIGLVNPPRDLAKI